MSIEIGSKEYNEQVELILIKAFDSGMTADEICKRLGF